MFAPSFSRQSNRRKVIDNSASGNSSQDDSSAEVEDTKSSLPATVNASNVLDLVQLVCVSSEFILHRYPYLRWCMCHASTGCLRFSVRAMHLFPCQCSGILRIPVQISCASFS